VHLHSRAPTRGFTVAGGTPNACTMSRCFTVPLAINWCSSPTAGSAGNAALCALPPRMLARSDSEADASSLNHAG